MDSIRKGIDFQGINVWILVFAIFLASIGLNVNSTAVIIGAMLISPLMGPIMGVGLGLGIFDFDLVKSAAKNLAVMVVVSLTASTIYFSLSPLSQAQSELLSRTTPTIWDVLIAMFGGLAGIVAGSSKEKGTVIPGVAIATALMPPLCTAGFGIAHGDLKFFIGAFYLFCINAVFISVSAFVVVRLLKFSKHTFVDKRAERKIKNVITIIVLITVIPSVYIAYVTVKKAVFEQRATAFITNEFRFEKTLVLTQHIDFENNRIDLMLIGDPVPKDSIEILKEKTSAYKLTGITLNISQGINDNTAINVNALKSGIIQDVYARNEKVLDEKDRIILGLQNEVLAYKRREFPVGDIAKELNALNENIRSVSIQRNAFYNLKSQKADTLTTVYVDFLRKPSVSESRKIEQWLKVRTLSDTIKFIRE
ncbi:MAG: TIGR00341 family protein [Bacteroidota bacterium]|nr:TIGR00341 family protein [Bacteroidota bacterium]